MTNRQLAYREYMFCIHKHTFVSEGKKESRDYRGEMEEFMRGEKRREEGKKVESR